VANGVLTYLVVLAGILVLGLVLSMRGATQGTRLSLAIGGAVFVLVLVLGLAAPEAFLRGAHFVATVAFFGLMAADAVLNAFGRTTSEPPPRWLRIVYIVIAVVLVVVMAGLILATLATILRTPDAAEAVFPWILVGEAIALLAFLAFWWLQTWQRWNESDPASLLPIRFEGRHG
jgi:hypothetical protein